MQYKKQYTRQKITHGEKLQAGGGDKEEITSWCHRQRGTIRNKKQSNAEFKCRMKEVTQPRAGNPAEAELGRRYVGSACALGWLQAEGFPTSAACSASGGFMPAAQHFLHTFFFTSRRSGVMLQPPVPRGGPAAHGWHGVKLSDQNHNCFPENGSYRNYPKCSLIQNGLAGGKLSASTKVSSVIKNSDRPYQKPPAYRLGGSGHGGNCITSTCPVLTQVLIQNLAETQCK